MAAGEYVYINQNDISFESRKSSASETSDVVNFSDYRLLSLSGLCITEKEIIESNFSTHFTFERKLDELINASGEWIAVAASHEARRILVLSDPLGYAPVFYSIVNEKIFISDSFQSVSSALSKANIVPELNLPYYFSLISHRSAQFQNMYGADTLSKQINILPADKILLITENSIELIQRDILLGSDNNLDYSSLIHRGIESNISKIGMLSKFHEDRRITLSGGVDSRLVLGFLNSTEVKKSFKIHSIDPSAWGNPAARDSLTRDIILADKLRTLYSMDWWCPNKRNAISLSYRESLALHQTYRSNYSFTFNPSSMHVAFDRPQLTLRGGGGELLRSTNGGSALDQIRINTGLSVESNESFAKWFAAQMLTSEIVPAGFRTICEQNIATSFIPSKGSFFEEKVNYYYFLYRNRSHFGHIRHTRSTNETIFLPLSNPFLVQASKHLNFDDRANGKLVSDIFSMMDPRLIDIPFESRKWNKVLTSSSYDDTNWNDSSWQNSRPNRDRSPIPFRSGKGRNDRAEFYSFDSWHSGLNYLREGFGILEDLVDSDFRSELQSFHRKVLSLAMSGHLPLNNTVAKLASALDVFLTVANVSDVTLLGDCADSFAAPEKAAVSSLVRDKSFVDLDVFELRPNIRRTESGFTIKAQPVESRRKDFLYAFYLMKDGERLLTKWYSSKDSHSFTIDVMPGNYHAIAFARLHSHKGYTFQAQTTSISIA